MERDIAYNYTLWLQPDEIPTSPFGPAGADYANDMMTACTQQMQAAADPYSDIVLAAKLPVTLSAGTKNDVYNNAPHQIGQPENPTLYDDLAAYDLMDVNVRCKGIDQPPPEPANLTNIDLFMTTYKGDSGYTENGLLRCKKMRILVRATASTAGLTTIRLHQIRNGQQSFEDVTMATEQLAEGVHQAEFSRWVNPSEYTHVEALAAEVEDGNESGLNSGWEDISLLCESSAGHGGLVQDGSQPPEFDLKPEEGVRDTIFDFGTESGPIIPPLPKGDQLFNGSGSR